MVCVLYVDFCSNSTYDNSTYTYCDLELGINDGEVYSDVQNNVVIASEYNSQGDNTNFGLESDNNHPPLSLCEKCGNFDTEGSSNSPYCNQREITSPGPNCTVPQEKVLLERPTARTHKRTEMPLTRKRSRIESKWVSVKRKKLRQHYHAYIMSSGKMAEGKSVQCCKIDHENCRFKCAKKFDELTRQAIHTGHWSLVDDEKHNFYINTTITKNKSRTRRAENTMRKKVSYSFFFFGGENKVRVCKEIYLKTLNIDAKRISNAHKSKNFVTGTPSAYRHGKHTKKTCKEFVNSIRRHIESVPVIESH